MYLLVYQIRFALQKLKLSLNNLSCLFFMMASNVPRRFWPKGWDVFLCRELMITRPHQYRPGTQEYTKAWASVITNLGKNIDGFTFDAKAARDHYNNLLQKMRRAEVNGERKLFLLLILNILKFKYSLMSYMKM